MPDPDVMVWDEFALSGRGLLARPVMPNNVIALKEHISAISFNVYDVTDSENPVLTDSDVLVVDDVMLSAPSGKNTWAKDQIGYTFNWPADGALWPDPNKSYQIVVNFTTTVLLGSKQFVRVWRNNTKDPASA